MLKTIFPFARCGNFENLFNYLLFFIPRFLFLFILQVGPIVVIAQTAETQYAVQFKQTETTYYTITDTTRAFTSPEIVKLRKQVVIDSVVRNVDLNNDLTTTIYHLKDTQLEDWMTRPAKTVIDKDQTVVYDENNGVMIKSPHGDKYLQNYKMLKQVLMNENSDLIPSFPFVDQNLINSFTDNGYKYSDQGAEGCVFLKDTIEIRINNDELTNTIIIYSGQGIIQSYIKHGFIKNDLGQVVPSFTIKKAWDERFSDRCVRKIVVTDFDNYRIIYADGNKLTQPAALDDPISIYPNPAMDQLNITLQPGYFTSATVEIMDATGNILLSNYIPVVADDMEIPISTLSSGYYFLRLYDDNKEISKSFYKN